MKGKSDKKKTQKDQPPLSISRKPSTDETGRLLIPDKAVIFCLEYLEAWEAGQEADSLEQPPPK